MALARLPFTINGVDFSTAVSRTEYRIYYEDRQGENEVMMLNGDEYPDILDRRPVISWPLNSLWADELASLFSAIGDAQFVTVTYFDTRTNTTATGSFRASISEQLVGKIDSTGKLVTGMTLTLRSM